MSGGLLAVDVGGTFTDVIGIRDGRIEAVKVASERESVEQAVLAGAKQLGVQDRTAFNHASTVGLNAVLTRRLPKVALLTTFGHRDVLDIARCWRPAEALTDPNWRRSYGDAAAPLVPRYLRRGVRERITAAGDILIELDEQQARFELERLKRCDVQGVAICLINAYVNPAHELALGELVADVLGPDIARSISSSVSPLAKEFPRAATTVIDVLMKLIYERYTAELYDGLRADGFSGELNFADSAATLLDADYAMRKPFRLVFSGPAAGAVASAHFGRLIGDDHLLCCDVGGTSSDISVVTGGEPQLNSTFALEQDLFINALSVELGTLGAGGGSIVSVTNAGEIRVGPESAGADPGPACYGRGGTAPTMTDAFLAIGLLDADRFNAGQMKLEHRLSLDAFAALDSPLTLEHRIAYAYRIGLNNIAEGLIDATIARGLDPRDYSLMAFGAAGPLMLPAILGRVRARRVIVPPFPGLFSALGLLSTNRVYSDSASAYTVLSPDAAGEIAAVFERVEAEVRSQLPAGADVLVKRTFDGRLVGQSWETPFIDVPEGPIDEAAVQQMIAGFHDEYETRYGNRFEAIPVQSVTYRVQLVAQAPKVTYPELDAGGAHPEPTGTAELHYLDEPNRSAGVYEREQLRTGQMILGPAIIREPTSTTHVVAGQQAVVGTYGEIVIEGVK
jgi:N-methylhydantoinase A